MKRAFLTAVCTFLLLLSTTPIALAADGRITVTYNNGGSLNVPSAVKTEGNVIYVEDDSKVELVATPNEGYEVAGVYLNDQSMHISGPGPQSILVAPKGTSVTLRITFLRSENAGEYPPAAEPPPLTSPTPSTPSQPILPATTTEPASGPQAPPALTEELVPPASSDTPSLDSPATPDAPDALDTGDISSDAHSHTSELEDVPNTATPTPPSTSLSPEQSEPSIITDEISNGGVGGLTGDAVSAEQRTAKLTKVLVIGSSLVLAAAVTVLITRKGTHK